MARAYGSSAHLLMKRETAYGQAAIRLVAPASTDATVAGIAATLVAALD